MKKRFESRNAIFMFNHQCPAVAFSFNLNFFLIKQTFFFLYGVVRTCVHVVLLVRSYVVAFIAANIRTCMPSSRQSALLLLLPALPALGSGWHGMALISAFPQP